jgi:HD-GYP domain-containing protein (c-di-GMP phosphodiesterase class II)
MGSSASVTDNGARTSAGPLRGAATTSAAIDHISRSLDEMSRQLRRSYLESTRALVAAVEARDPYWKAHSSTVAQYARNIAQRLNLSEVEIQSIETAAMLHDIGKIGVPDAILNKSGPLTDEEFEVVKRHPAIGVGILGHTTYLKKELPLILHHHERHDGAGYPAGLAGEQIPLGARVLNVADALDTMLSRRSYKSPMTPGQARRELLRCRGGQFDPRVVDAALRWLDETNEADLVLAAEDAPA